MIDETGAAAPTDAPAPQGGPAESEPATQPPEQPTAEAAPENAETDEQGDTDNSEPRKLSRNQRLQRKASRLAAIVAEQAAKIEDYERAKSGGADDAPKAADYPQGEWDPGYLSDLAAHKAAKRISDELTSRDRRSQQETLASARQEAIEEFEDRAAAFKVLTPDFDQKIAELAKSLPGGLSPYVAEEIQDSEVGPAILYQLAANPRKALELNSMSPREVAREIGRLEAKTSLPNPKKQTSARAPIAPLSGGASPPQDLKSLAKSYDATAYIQARNQQEKARAKP
jgi:hypothetical protein